jgi:hypothetical protein
MEIAVACPRECVLRVLFGPEYSWVPHTSRVRYPPLRCHYTRAYFWHATTNTVRLRLDRYATNERSPIALSLLVSLAPWRSLLDRRLVIALAGVAYPNARVRGCVLSLDLARDSGVGGSWVCLKTLQDLCLPMMMTHFCLIHLFGAVAARPSSFGSPSSARWLTCR